MSRAEETFGQMVKRLREERGLQQKDFARKVKIKKGHISPATISHIEGGRIYIGEQTGRSIIEALNPDETTRRRLELALKYHIETHRESEIYSTGRVLDVIMRQHKDKLSAADLAEYLDRSVQAVNFWRAGNKLPSGEVMNKILKYLARKGVPKSDRMKLKAEHLYETIMSDARLSFLSPGERRAMAEAGRDFLLEQTKGRAGSKNQKRGTKAKSA